MGNSERVQEWRKTKGNSKQNELYKKLRDKYKIPSVQACKMKYWSNKNINIWLIENGYVEVTI